MFVTQTKAAPSFIYVNYPYLSTQFTILSVDTTEKKYKRNNIYNIIEKVDTAVSHTISTPNSTVLYSKTDLHLRKQFFTVTLLTNTRFHINNKITALCCTCIMGVDIPLF